MGRALFCRQLLLQRAAQLLGVDLPAFIKVKQSGVNMLMKPGQAGGRGTRMLAEINRYRELGGLIRRVQAELGASQISLIEAHQRNLDPAALGVHIAHLGQQIAGWRRERIALFRRIVGEEADLISAADLLSAPRRTSNGKACQSDCGNRDEVAATSAAQFGWSGGSRSLQMPRARRHMPDFYPAEKVTMKENGAALLWTKAPSSGNCRAIAWLPGSRRTQRTIAPIGAEVAICTA